MSSEIVKLSSQNYHIWKTQMLLLMRNHNIDGLVDDTIEGPTASSKGMLELDQHESLLKNWILDSVSKDLLVGKIHLRSAKDIWDYLKWNYDLTLTSEIVKLSGQHNYHLWRTEMLSLVNSYIIDGLMDDTSDTLKDSSNEIMDQYDSLLRSWIFDSISQDVLLKVNMLSSTKEIWEKLKSIYGPTMSYEIDQDKSKTSETKDIITRRNEKLRRATMVGQWWEVETILRNDTNAVGEVINNDGETLLHIAVGTGHNYFVRKLLDFIEGKEILKRRSLDGSTALHIAAITGNNYAAGLLIEKEKSLIGIRNRDGTLPYVAAYSNNHFGTSVFLFKATNPKRQSKGQGLRKDLTDRNLLLDVISTKQYDLALQLLEAYQDLAVKDDAEVLMTLARNFPTGLSYSETLIYPSLSDIRERIVNKTSLLFTSVEFFQSGALTKPVEGVLLVLVTIAILVYQLILFPIWIVYLAFLMLYFLMWNIATIVVPPIKHIKKRKKEWEKAKEVLKMVCEKIDNSEPVGINHSLYKRPFLEAACQNAYEVVVEILSRSPKASRWTDKNGYNIIHLAVIYRSGKVYNLIHDIVDRKILSKSHIDSYNNNVLHLVGKLAPSNKLKRRTGAALQLQRELQWREEVKKRVVPTFTTQKNTFEETPAAITVPGGSNQTTGIPLFTKEAAFILLTSSLIKLSTFSITSGKKGRGLDKMELFE
ncbi:hypothetical protein L2E82_39066 [Cichorium intybus]|uniref:Uncharacterized protein n=1 Tax=Cichorium intybus TaxID=13427 RepID=A0ACB9AHT3_CICIN|nr:hypothetical protein L2E82_39066 [Cichorium intybus]